MNSILIFGAGKSATYLIEYLCKTCEAKDWDLLVCDTNIKLAEAKIAGSKNAKAISIDVGNNDERKTLVANADIVISLLPPQLHFLVAKDCIEFSKNLLTASYIDEEIRALEEMIKEKGLLFLCEMGLDPGIDHMSAMNIINRIKNEGGRITSFKSHCGGLVAPEDDDNPWHYKITWNPGNIVRAGSSGAVFKKEGQIVTVPYPEVFKNCTEVSIPGLFSLAWYPNRDSLSYIPTYGLSDVQTFIRTTLRYPSFCRGWNKIVNLNLTATDDFEIIKNAKTYAGWFNIKRGNISQNEEINIGDPYGAEFAEQAEYLHLWADVPLEPVVSSSASVLQHLLETRLEMKQDEKDMIVMLHEIDYESGGKAMRLNSSLVVKGIDRVHTAMAKTVGLPLGIAAKLVMEGKIKITGLHIPTIPEIYEPVLAELQEHSICFEEVTTPH